MVHVLTVIGARPQFIKAAAVSRAIAEIRGLRETLIHSGQHYDRDMSQVFFDELGIPKPQIHLGVGSGSHAVQTGHMMIELEKNFQDQRPDIVLVYGDTNTTLAAALVAAKLQIPLAHVEAGLRSFNRSMPEEINRLVTDQLSDILFTPTVAAERNLRREGVDPAKVYTVGDVMFDASLMFRSRALSYSNIRARLRLESASSYVLATIHRAGNTDVPKNLKEIVKGLQHISRTLPVVWPIHPRTRQSLARFGISIDPSSGLKLIDPVGYLDMVALEAGAMVIVTDSGGVQKEAFFHRVPCVTVRSDTEWGELVDAGVNRLCPPVAEQMIEVVSAMKSCDGDWSAPDYGNGGAAASIAAVLSRGFVADMRS